MTFLKAYLMRTFNVKIMGEKVDKRRCGQKPNARNKKSVPWFVSPWGYQFPWVCIIACMVPKWEELILEARACGFRENIDHI